MHQIIKCKKCETIIAQCRCPGEKQTTYRDSCLMCAKPAPKNTWDDLLPEHSNVKPIDDFNKGYLRAIEVMKAKCDRVIPKYIAAERRRAAIEAKDHTIEEIFDKAHFDLGCSMCEETEQILHKLKSRYVSK